MGGNYYNFQRQLQNGSQFTSEELVNGYKSVVFLLGLIKELEFVIKGENLGIKAVRSVRMSQQHSLAFLFLCFCFVGKTCHHAGRQSGEDNKMRVYLGVRTCEVFLCFVTIVFVLSIVLSSLFSLFYVTREGNRFLHRG